MAERLKPQLQSPDFLSAVINVEQMRKLAKDLRNKGWLTTSHHENIQVIFKKWGGQGSLAGAEAIEFFRGKLTPEGEKHLLDANRTLKDSLAKAFSSLNPDSLSQSTNFLSGVDPDLARSLQEGPSSLIAGAVADRLARSTGTSRGKKVPIKAWVLNPGAAIEVARAVADEAGSRAQTRKAISETVRWVAGVAADDTKRDALINYVNSLEKSLFPYLDKYCQDKNIPVPQPGTLERAAVLLRLNAEISTLQVKAREITAQGERLVAKQVNIQAETAEKRMLAKELPLAVEAAKEANVAKEEEIAEKTRHLLAKISGAISSGLIGAYNGLIGGLVNSVSALIRENPKVAVPVGVTLVALIIQVVGSETVTIQALETFALKSGLIGLFSAVATGIGAGLAGRLGKRGNTP